MVQISLCCVLLTVTEISGFFLPTLKNPLASKNTVNTGLVAPASAYSTSYTAPGLPGTNTTLDGDSGNSTAAAEEEEDGEYSLYSDVAELEYDYDEELYDEEEDNEPRSIPTDPIGRLGFMISEVKSRLETELAVFSRNFRIGLALLSFVAP